ncbi:diaminobutyrate--2-oxoglutarate transaminase [Aurantimonas sp. A2-1-M11]|uniref:diaminobutyrate--2-oxoglutarate transaminase n=1 Tax=Aurantimonas sp. A2-1-M11 TaxID=3113712 RepID=UPI002F92721A
MLNHTETPATTGAATFARLESEVRSYCRSFPTVFRTAQNATLTNVEGREYIDFLAGCASLNYGHNDPDMKSALVDYIMSDGVTHGLDMFTEAKEAFLISFSERILKPRGLDYRMMFQGPTGANAVEAALKLARKATGRENVIAFTNGYHGVTTGALAATGNGSQRAGSRSQLSGVTRMAYDGFHGEGVDSAQMLDDMLGDTSSGVDAPAAILLECIQGEGGLNVASKEFLQRLAAIAKKHGALLIIDDIQAGCGRSGDFFAFEFAGIQPDIVTMAKSLSGFGLPLSMVLVKPEYDVFTPAEHNGTFRGNNHAFVTARAALEKYWADDSFAKEIRRKADVLNERLSGIAESYGFRVKGRGMMRGIDTGSGDKAAAICAAAFERGLIIETAGSSDEIVKVLAPLTITDEVFARGLDIVAEAFEVTLREPARVAAE